MNVDVTLVSLNLQFVFSIQTKVNLTYALIQIPSPLYFELRRGQTYLQLSIFSESRFVKDPRIRVPRKIGEKSRKVLILEKLESKKETR